VQIIRLDHPWSRLSNRQQQLTKFTRCAAVRFAATGCSALRAEDALRPAKRELGFAGLGQALRADFGFP